jgi:arylsulfatase A-like enzyme
VELGSLYTTADDLTDMAIEWLGERDRSTPAFAWVHYMDVHHPYVPPEEHQAPFRKEPIGERRAIRLRRKMLEEPGRLTEQEESDIIDLYDAEIRFTDAEVSRLIDAAKQELDEPVLVFTSDHGEELGERGRYGHGYLHDECLHVPLILDDGNEDGNKYDHLVGLMDVAPTLVDYANASPPDSFYGHSLRTVIEGGDWQRSSVISEYGDVEGDWYCSYRDQEWSYISDEDGDRLYNRSSDPEETTNVAHEQDAVVASIEEKIASHADELEASQSDIDGVDMDDEVVDRLEQLGYKME